VDNIVYIHQWRDFLKECREEWTLYGSWALALLLFDALLLMAPGTSTLVAIASIIVCNLAALSAVSLLVKHQRLMSDIAPDLAMHLKDAKHETSGFQSYAVQLSLPKALFLWAIAISSTQALFWLRNATNVYVPAGLVAVVVIVWLLGRAVGLLQAYTVSLRNAYSGFRGGQKDTSELPV